MPYNDDEGDKKRLIETTDQGDVIEEEVEQQKTNEEIIESDDKEEKKAEEELEKIVGQHEEPKEDFIKGEEQIDDIVSGMGDCSEEVEFNKKKVENEEITEEGILKLDLELKGRKDAVSDCLSRWDPDGKKDQDENEFVGSMRISEESVERKKGYADEEDQVVEEVMMSLDRRFNCTNRNLWRSRKERWKSKSRNLNMIAKESNIQ